MRCGLAPGGYRQGCYMEINPKSAGKSQHGQQKERGALLSRSEEYLLCIVPVYKNG